MKASFLDSEEFDGKKKIACFINLKNRTCRYIILAHNLIKQKERILKEGKEFISYFQLRGVLHFTKTMYGFSASGHRIVFTQFILHIKGQCSIIPNSTPSQKNNNFKYINLIFIYVYLIKFIVTNLILSCFCVKFLPAYSVSLMSYTTIKLNRKKQNINWQ